MINSWTMTRRWAGILVAMMMITVPAAAAVITQNFMRADVSVNAACFTKTAGTDVATGSAFIEFNDASTITDPSGFVQLIQETLTVNGFAGDRVIYSDAVRFNNNCTGQIEVALISENAPNNGLAVEPAYVSGGFWDDVDVYMYLANNGAPAGLPGISGDWSLVMRVSQGTVTDDINRVVIPENSTRRMAVVLDTDDGVDATATGSLRWTAQAIHP